jgi:hypothetical protein
MPQVFVHLAGLQLLLAGGRRAAVVAGLSGVAACLIRADVLGLAHFRVRVGGDKGQEGNALLCSLVVGAPAPVPDGLPAPLPPAVLFGCAAAASHTGQSSIQSLWAAAVKHVARPHSFPVPRAALALPCPSCTCSLNRRGWHCLPLSVPPSPLPSSFLLQLPSTLVSLVSKVFGPLLSDMGRGPTVFLAGRSPQQAAAAAAALAAAVGGGAGGSGGGAQVGFGCRGG